MILVASRVSGLSALRSARCAHAGRRFLQTTLPAGANSAEAYLEPNHDRPGIVSLLLNRPKSKNAISLRLLKELQECLDTVQFDKSARVLIVRSSTIGSFCAGADLIERATMSKAQVDKFLIDLRRALGTLENLPVPTVAAIDGPALGGGLEMALACDLRVAGHAVTKIGLPETKLGIIPGAGGTQRLTRLLGTAKAKDLIFTARVLTAQQAHELGVVDYISSPETTGYDRALQLAGEISSSAPLALRAAKQAISRVPDLGFESGLDFERASYEPLLHSKDRTEALQAFKEKRVPVFKGE
ncbi:ClpP/crotonase [Dichomitus squalens]|uniref:ClpP/crotonase n=1 Tax=Dichomitus squalens TaxID=114155 RepID=A0A4Q9P3S9_9APHY|nr:ClpP/crotonase [Dichomitus squalens LYAD-421 SS1]EJF62828.1 ClpP/crotonase [Dichomitus squalens LYAD-421 SS1]TBU49034.1 ClpP/crotonase [Dichomitus squalens]TBU64125.1 ClpP/crotonase [Dichomitus squalens]